MPCIVASRLETSRSSLDGARDVGPFRGARSKQSVRLLLLLLLRFVRSALWVKEKERLLRVKSQGEVTFCFPLIIYGCLLRGFVVVLWLSVSSV